MHIDETTSDFLIGGLYGFLLQQQHPCASFLYLLANPIYSLMTGEELASPHPSWPYRSGACLGMMGGNLFNFYNAVLSTSSGQPTETTTASSQL